MRSPLNLLQTNQAQLIPHKRDALDPSPFLFSSLDLLQLLVIFVLRSPDLSTVLQVGPLPNAPQVTIGPSCHEDTLPAHGQLAAYQDSQVLLCRAALQKVTPQSVLGLGIIPSHMQSPAFAFVKPH